MKINLLIIAILICLPFNFVRADTVGQIANFGIAPEYDTQARSNIASTLRYVSSKAYWYVADEYWNSISDGARTETLNKIKILANEFDTRIYPIETGFFGSEPNPGIDNDSRILIALIPMKNSAGGYIDTANSVPKKILPRSNEREMVYLNINLFNDISRVQSYLAHEFQHLITLYEKDIVRDSPDDVWLNELRSEYAVDILGYNYQNSSTNLQRRALTFLQNTKDSLTEWRNELIDYSSIALFANYIGEKFGKDVIGQTTRVKDAGINAIKATLKQKSVDVDFESVFISWWVANLINDSKSKYFGYENTSLKNFAVKPEKIMTLNSYYPVDTVSVDLKDWQGGWYQITRPEDGERYTRINFSSSSMSSFVLGVIKFKPDNSYDVLSYKFDGKNSELIFDWIEGDYSNIFFMPFKKDRFAGFTEDEKAVRLNFITSNLNNLAVGQSVSIFKPVAFGLNSMDNVSGVLVGEDDLKEGDFIKSLSSPDIFIINEYGYKRLVLNPKICLMYGHLGARGCFSATKNVSASSVDKYQTSFYFTNGEINDKIIYQLIMIDEDNGYLKKVSEFVDPKKVFKINTKEFKSYQLRQ